MQVVSEFIGTFSLIFIGAGAAAVIGEGIGLPGITAIALAHGLTVTAFAFAYGPVSGGHFNPSVTIAVLAAGAMLPGRPPTTSSASSLAVSSVRSCCGPC